MPVYVCVWASHLPVCRCIDVSVCACVFIKRDWTIDRLGMKRIKSLMWEIDLFASMFLILIMNHLLSYCLLPFCGQFVMSMGWEWFRTVFISMSICYDRAKNQLEKIITWPMYLHEIQFQSKRLDSRDGCNRPSMMMEGRIF